MSSHSPLPTPTSISSDHTSTHLPPDTDHTPTERLLPPLPLQDTGAQAWSFVAAAFGVETMLWGMNNSSGVWVAWYGGREPFSKASVTEISLIGSLALFVGYSLLLPLLLLHSRSPRLLKPSMWAGLVICVGSLVGASFVTDVRGLVALQGVGFGISSAVCLFPIVRWIPEWFNVRKGLAAGIIFTGGGVGGAFMPIVTSTLLNKVGSQWTLRIWALAMAVVLFINPRIPIASSSIAPPATKFNGKGLVTLPFLGCFLSTLLQGFGFFNVSLYLPEVSTSLGYTSGAALLSAFNISCVVSQIMWGAISDHMPPSTAMSISSLIGSLLAFLLFGFSSPNLGGFPTLLTFSILFGLASGGFTSMWSQSAGAIARDDKDQQTILFSGFSIARGLGSILGPTVGSLVYHSDMVVNAGGWGAGGAKSLVVLVGACLAGSAVVSVGFEKGETFWTRWRKRGMGVVDRDGGEAVAMVEL